VSILDSEDLFDYLADQNDRHARTTSWWRMNDLIARESIVASRPKLEDLSPFAFGPLGDIAFSYFRMGAIDSLDLFGLDELILFSFYWRNRYRYRAVADIGANIGLHSVVLAKMGLEVTSYEPDPVHLLELRRNLRANAVDQVTVVPHAVNTNGGSVGFTRVVGNTTGSHISGAKDDPYGELERFDVAATSVNEAIKGMDLIKMDVEGYEARLLLGLEDEDFVSLDVVGEIGSPSNARSIFERFSGTGVHLFSQKRNWQHVESVSDMPSNYREGSIFLSHRVEMPWR
jgi:FkbM family methyltransferase